MVDSNTNPYTLEEVLKKEEWRYWPLLFVVMPVGLILFQRFNRKDNTELLYKKL